ncbi:MAG TPA: SH3 domain-containing protein [Casimicrobium sp.]|nr:SH3 domain-containing protein [Casimicrobium sp.]
MSDAIHTHYKNLSVSETSPLEVIAASFFALMDKYSAERYPNDPEAARIRDVLAVSFAVLSKVDTRREHDAWIAARKRGDAPERVTAIATVAAPSATQNAHSTTTPWSPSKAAPVAASPVPSPSDDNAGLYAAGAAVAVIAFFVWIAQISGNKSEPPVPRTASVPAPVVSTPTAATPAVPAVTPQMTQSYQFEPDVATAAIAANVRSAPNGKSKVVRTIARATPLQKVGTEGTFMQVRLANGELGWVAQELLIPQSDAQRLTGQAATAYISSRASEKRLPTLDAAIVSGEVKRRIDATFASFAAPRLDMTTTLTQMRDIAQVRVPVPVSDDAAAVWYTLAATAARNAGDLNEALNNYLAAAEAGPGIGAHHSAIALAAYELGRRELLLAHAYSALALAPETTNSCLVFALALSSLSSAEQPREAAIANTLRLAIHYSRDAAFTTRYLKGLAAKATNPILARAIDRAISN